MRMMWHCPAGAWCGSSPAKGSRLRSGRSAPVTHPRSRSRHSQKRYTSVGIPDAKLQSIRRAEDLQSCAQMGAWARHFPIPDCIYRRLETDGTAPYASEAEIFGPLHLGEAALVESLSAELARGLTEQPVLICPLSLGGHVDHRLTRLAAERLDRSLWFYADYPYAEASAADLSGLIPEGWEMFVYPISAEGLSAWFRCVAAHRSQISTFWPDLDSMEASIQAYCRRHGGVRLWRERSTSKIGG